MLALNPDCKTYSYKGWHYQQKTRGKWLLRRDLDGFVTTHQSKGGCEAFIRLHGDAPDPDAHYNAVL